MSSFKRKLVLSRLIPKYLGKIRRSTNAQLLSWQIFNFIKFSSVIVGSIFLAQFVADKSLVKTYEQMILIGSTLSFFFISGLGQTSLTYFESVPSEEKETVFKSHFVLLGILGLLSSVGIIVYGYFQDRTHFYLYLLLAIVHVLNTPSFALENYYLALKKHVPLLIYGALSYFIRVVIVVVPLVAWGSLKWALIGVAVLSLIKFVFALMALKIGLRMQEYYQQVKALFVFSGPILLSFLLGGSFSYLSALIIEYFLSSKDFLLYTFGAREFPVFLIISNSFSLVFSQKIAAELGKGKLEEGLQAFRKQSIRVMHQLFPAAIVLMLSSQYLFTFFYGEYFTSSYIVFNFFLLLLVSRVLFPQTILLGLNKNNYFMWAAGLELFVGVGLSLILIRDYGMWGVCWAMIAAFLSEKIYLIFVCYKESISFFNYFPIRQYLIYTALLIISFFMSVQWAFDGINLLR